MARILTLIVAIAAGGCAGSLTRSGADLANTAPKSESVAQASELSATAGAHEFKGPREVIVEGQLAVDVMAVAASLRGLVLANRLQTAATENPDWWMEHLKKAKRGEPLPYDSRLDMSEDEYDELLAMSEQRTLYKKAEGTLTISTKGDHVFVLDGGESLADFTGIEIDLENDRVRTPFGIATERSEISATDRAFGPWNGVRWRFEDVDADELTGTTVELSVGKLERSGRGVILYRVIQRIPGKTTRIVHTLFYDLPKK